jgi:tetratricopeptide (TPR) repeat protein
MAAAPIYSPTSGTHHPAGCGAGKGLTVTDRWWWLWLLVFLLGCGGPAKTTVDLKKQAISLNEAGYQYYRESRWHLARQKFEQALTYNRLIDRRSGIAANLNNLGAIAREQGDLEQAVTYFQEALAVNRELHDAAATCETLNNLGLAYQSQGRLREANAAYLEALEAAGPLPPGPLLALTLTHLGDVARTHKDYTAALNYYYQALPADAAAKDRRGQALRQERLGRTFVDLQDFERAEVNLKEALGEFRRLQDTDGIAAVLKDLTLLALGRGDPQEARLNANLLLGIYQARGQEQEARELEALLKTRGGK